VGIAAGGAGGGLSLIKGWSDYNKCGSEIKEYIGKASPTMQTYILATKPHEFRGFCHDSDPGKKLADTRDKMIKESDALKNQLGIK